MNPQQIAEAVLEKIGEDDDRLYMRSWTNQFGWVKADQEVQCGTTLCAGGWIVHILGYNFESSGLTDATFKCNNVLYRRSIESVVQEAMELTEDENRFLLYSATSEDARYILHEIADGNSFPPLDRLIRRIEHVAL